MCGQNEKRCNMNERDIFVHDTPAQELFKRNPRAFSSGCIRVRKAIQLAEHILKQNDENSFRAMAAALQSGETTQIALATAIPIHIAYLTAWADEDGRAHFRDDIYDLDGLVDASRVPRREVKYDLARTYDRARNTLCLAAVG